MKELLTSLRVCNRSIEHWKDQRLAVAGSKETALSYWYTQRDRTLAGIRVHRHGCRGTW